MCENIRFDILEVQGLSRILLALYYPDDHLARLLTLNCFVELFLHKTVVQLDVNISFGCILNLNTKAKH